MDGCTVVLIVQNNTDILYDCVEWLGKVRGIENIILVDNGSNDGTSDQICSLGLDNIIFDEGAQGYGKLVNAVVDNFELSDIVVFMDIRFIPAPNSFLWMEQVFKDKRETIVGFTNRNDCCKLEEMIATEVVYEQDMIQGVKYSFDIDSGVWAVQRETLLNNGKFDESLYTAKNALMDYELRLIRNGNIPVIAERAYVYEMDVKPREENISPQNISKDRIRMKEKWNMNYFNLQPHYALIDLMDDDKEAELEVLEIGCDLGASLIEIKNRFHNANIHGLEINRDAVNISHNIMDIVEGNIENRNVCFKQKFDYVVFGDVLEHLRDPLGTVKYCKTLLKSDGTILASIPNIMHISVMKQLLAGHFEYQDTGLLDRTHIHFFTYYEILKMFEEAGFTVKRIEGSRVRLLQDEQILIEKLLELSSGAESFMYDVYQYLIKATGKDE